MYMLMSSGGICINVQMPLLFNCEMGKVRVKSKYTKIIIWILYKIINFKVLIFLKLHIILDTSDEYGDVYKKGVLRVLWRNK